MSEELPVAYHATITMGVRVAGHHGAELEEDCFSVAELIYEPGDGPKLTAAIREVARQHTCNYAKKLLSYSERTPDTDLGVTNNRPEPVNAQVCGGLS